jgi:hypothetical protein
MIEFKVSIDDVLALRDSVSEETVRMRLYVKETAHPSERTLQRLEVLEELLTRLKNIAFGTR